jgi:iron complex outermembrane receptor protein
LGEEDIAAEGVASIADLVAQIQNQTGSARGRGGGGRPITLVNGIRVGSFRELFSYPPEALAKVEVFPEEVAVRFGFPPDRRVINLILKENFGSREVELEFEGPARGGRFVNEQEFGYLKIANGGRFNFNFTADDASLLTEDERGIIQTPGSTSDLESDPNQAEFRSLQPDRRGFDANISWARAYLKSGLSVSANAAYQREDTRFVDGVNLVTLTDPNGESLTRTFGENDPLERRTATDTGSLAGSLSAPLGNFRLTSTFDSSLTESTTQIDNPFDTQALQDAAADGTLALDGPLPSEAEAGFETAFSRVTNASNLNTIRGPLAYLPGGELLTTFDLGYSWNRLESSDTRTLQDVQLTRGNLQTGANVVIPITSRRNGFADALGSFTLNAQVGLEELSDFGTLGDYNVSLNWEPTDGLALSATYIYREVAPGLASLGNPQITSFNVPVFDFVNGETVLATVTSGGNPDLPAETQRDWKFAVNWELPFVDGTRFTVEYIRNRSDDVTSAFPQITQEIEGAFPDRITRDADGTLVALDRRPVNFAETRSDRLQFRLSTRGGFGQGAGGGRGGRGGPPQGARGGQPSRGGPPSGAGGPPSPEQRAAFMAMREKLCADDGLDWLKRLVAAAKAGEDLSDIAPGLPPQAIERILSRIGANGGDVSDEDLAQARSRICSFDPSALGGAPTQAASGRPSTGGRPGGARSGGFNPLARGGRRGWRYFANLTHTIELQNEILIAPGVAVLDQLDGDATGAFGFPRHSSRLEAGLFGNGVGMRLSGRYTGETRLDGAGTPGSSDLFFDDLATFDIRVFTNIDQLTGGKTPAFKNLRISLRMDNIFDAQRAVRDENGNTPINYQPFVIDPVGRFIGIDIRKLF